MKITAAAGRPQFSTPLLRTCASLRQSRSAHLRGGRKLGATGAEWAELGLPLRCCGGYCGAICQRQWGGGGAVAPLDEYSVDIDSKYSWRDALCTSSFGRRCCRRLTIWAPIRGEGARPFLALCARRLLVIYVCNEKESERAAFRLTSVVPPSATCLFHVEWASGDKPVASARLIGRNLLSAPRTRPLGARGVSGAGSGCNGCCALGGTTFRRNSRAQRSQRK